MELVNEKILDEFRKYPEGSKEFMKGEAHVIVKYFNPVGTWIITEAEPLSNGDWRLYGLCDLFEPEFGPVLLSELQSLKYPYDVERDLYLPENCTLREAMERTCIENPRYFREKCHPIKIENIEWDVDSPEDKEYLPKEINAVKEIFSDDPNNEELLKELIPEILTDRFGFFVKNFTIGKLR